MSLSCWQLRHARRTLLAEGLIAYPTEAVYGLGCDPLSLHAVERLLALKGRLTHKGLILIAAEKEQLDPYVAWDALPPERLSAIFSTWPGPVTWLLPARPEVPLWLVGEHETIAVRITAHPVARELCLIYAGALVSTSANMAGRSPARSALGVRIRFGERVDLVLHATVGGRRRPTEIRNGITGRTVRRG